MSKWFWKNLNFILGWTTAILLFVLLVVLANVEIKDYDLWLHLASGKVILETYMIPKVDVFSCTLAGHPWVNHEWLFQIIVQSVFQHFGVEGLVLIRLIFVGGIPPDRFTPTSRG